MPKETLDTRDLVSDARQNRYLQELSDHIEDSGGPAAVGNPAELAETFNVYARPRRNRKIAFILFLGLIAFASVSFISHGELWDNNFIDNYNAGSTPIERSIFAPFAGVFLILGFIFYFPVMMFGLMPLYAGISLFHIDVYTYDVFGTFFSLAPYLSAIFWMGVATMLSFTNHYEIFQRNPKRLT